MKNILKNTSLKANITSNFVGNIYGAIVGLIFVPFYLLYIGPEGYGLIGVFASLQTVLYLLDSGLSTTLNKELAKLSVLSNTAQRMRNLVKTVGTVYWGLALLAGLIAVCISPFLANYWVQPEELSVEIITYSFILLSITFVFQLPSGFYSGGLLGLQRQVILNIIRIVFATLKSVGALLVLIFVSKSVLAFFGWNLIISILGAFTYKSTLWYYLPKTGNKTIFDKQELKNIGRFAAGMTGISLVGILLTQVDKIILSRILALEQFGYYALAYTVGAILYKVIGPISQSYFPKFTTLVAKNDEAYLKNVYHQACQLATLLVVPLGFFLAMFSKEVLFIWTHDNILVDNTWQVTSIVAVAVSFHCLMYMPYMLCLSYSYTKLAIYSNIAILIFLVPGTVFMATRFGGVGGALCWLITNTIYLIINPYLVHRKFLKGEASTWYWSDTLKPMLGCLAILLVFRFSYTIINSFLPSIFLLVAIGGISFVMTILLSTELKNILILRINKYRENNFIRKSNKNI